MATKNYMINDKWLDLDKQNIVELQSVDGVLDSLKVNGSEIETPSGKITITENGTDIDIAQYALADVNVEGGGGSSDFSTAEVTFVEDSTSPDGSNDCNIICIFTDREGNELMESLQHVPEGEDVVTAVLYKGYNYTYMSSVTSVSGNVTNNDGDLVITGDCTIHFIGIEEI